MFVLAALVNHSARASTIQFLSPFGLNTGVAYGVDGLKVVGESNIGWLYDGNSYQVIQVPWGGTTIPLDVSGTNIVGSSGVSSFLFDGLNYTKLTHPLGINGTVAWGIDGSNIVGEYIDASSITHGFLYDGTSYTTVDVPAAKHTFLRGISGADLVGYYTDAKNLIHGFRFNGTTYTTFDDPLFLGAGISAAQGIDGNTIVGNNSSTPFAAAYYYDGATFNHPFGIEAPLSGDHRFYGVSGNRIVGEFNNRPFIYVIPEPSSILMAILAGFGLFGVAHRKRNRASPRR
ncbi:MAG: hypothetical protein AB7E74_20660 [Pirellulales bacterium]